MLDLLPEVDNPLWSKSAYQVVAMLHGHAANDGVFTAAFRQGILRDHGVDISQDLSLKSHKMRVTVAAATAMWLTGQHPWANSPLKVWCTGLGGGSPPTETIPAHLLASTMLPRTGPPWPTWMT